MNRSTTVAVADAMTAVRADWQQGGCIAQLQVAGHTWQGTDAELAAHALAVAADPNNHTPGAINAVPTHAPPPTGRQQPLDEIRIRNQAIRGCTLCDPAGYLPGGVLCHHNPQQTESEDRAAAKARARAAAEDARAKSKWKPGPEPDQRRVQEPWPQPDPQETPA